jgi:uncharacterized membrane protein YdjX (TVP38/TMEM64 family)
MRRRRGWVRGGEAGRGNLSEGGGRGIRGVSGGAQAGGLTEGLGAAQRGRMDSSPYTKARHRRRRLAALALCGLGALATGVGALLLPAEMWGHARDAVMLGMEWLRELGAGWFFAAFAVLPAIGAPVSPFAFGAGSLFGPVLGLPTVLLIAGVAMAVSMTISYGLARYILRPWVERLLAYLGYKVPEIPRDKAVLFVFLVRMTPGAPYVFQSFLLGLAEVPFRVYLVVSWLVATTNVSLMIVFGDAIMQGRGKVALAALAGVVVMVLAVRFARKRLAARTDPASIQPDPALEARASDV